MAARELSRPPRMAALYPQAVAGSGLAALRRLPLIEDAPSELPEEELVLADVEIDRGHLAGYCRVCTFQAGDELPVTYPHVVAFPLALKLMTSRSFPFALMGLVHIANRIELLRPIGVGERLAFTARTEGLGPHDKGTKFDVVAEAAAGGETVWRSRSTYLHREGAGSGGDRKRERPDPPEGAATFAVPGDIGRRYAAVSGDRNPIHLHSLTARLFGMPRPIAHGMWMKARCLAVLEPRLPPAYSVAVQFKLPVQLPARVALAWEAGRVALHDAKTGKPHLTGEIGR